MISKKKKLVILILFSLIVSAVLSFLFLIGVLSGIQLGISDFLYGGKKANADIVIIAIDDKSLQDIGRWPWNRTIYVKALEKVREAKVIALDIAFFEPSEDDEILANEISKLREKIVLAFELNYDRGTEAPPEALMPVESLVKSGASLGYVNVITDYDGITRSLFLKVKNYSSFSLAIYKIIQDGRKESGKESSKEERKEVEIKEEGRKIINFAEGFKRISFSDVLSKDLNFSFKDKIVLIGATSQDLHDNYFVPTSKGKATPGVEIHASAVQNLIENSFLKNEPKLLVVLSIIVISFILLFFVYKTRLWITFLIALGLLMIYNIIAIKIFEKGIIMNLVYPGFTLLLSLISLTAASYLIEEKNKKEIARIFGHYVSESVAKRIIEHAEKSKEAIKGEEKEITVLFTDIRGFTSFSEKLEPREVVAILNRYLTIMANAIIKYEGTLDKYTGDGLMAFFNAPIQQEDHEILALKAAIEILKQVKKIKVKRLEGLGQRQRIERLYCGIGINTGKAVIGNIGSKQRHDFTAIGDTVNTAARLCGIAKKNEIIISKATYLKIKDKIKEIKREVGVARIKIKKMPAVKLKGKTKPLEIYLVKI
ncbi:MAG: adenylate/guanylate cyclase domain-containing protein [Candidatus Pacearchaeota archaeon]